MTLSLSAVPWRQMHSRAVSDTEQDACACLYSLPVISILAPGDKTHSEAFCRETPGPSVHTSNTTAEVPNLADFSQPSRSVIPKQGQVYNTCQCGKILCDPDLFKKQKKTLHPYMTSVY